MKKFFYLLFMLLCTSLHGQVTNFQIHNQTGPNNIDVQIKYGGVTLVNLQNLPPGLSAPFGVTTPGFNFDLIEFSDPTGCSEFYQVSPSFLPNGFPYTNTYIPSCTTFPLFNGVSVIHNVVVAGILHHCDIVIY